MAAACRALLRHEREDACGRRKRRRVLMTLDEFPSLGRVEAFAHHMKLKGSYGLNAALVVQGVNGIVAAHARRTRSSTTATSRPRSRRPT